jgi:hypothetical protein
LAKRKLFDKQPRSKETQSKFDKAAKVQFDRNGGLVFASLESNIENSSMAKTERVF